MNYSDKIGNLLHMLNYNGEEIIYSRGSHDNFTHTSSFNYDKVLEWLRDKYGLYVLPTITSKSDRKIGSRESDTDKVTLFFGTNIYNHKAKKLNRGLRPAFSTYKEAIEHGIGSAIENNIIEK